MSELRTRMIQAMTARGFSPRTQETYVRAVVGLVRHYRRAPDQLSADEVQAYIARLFRERKLAWSSCSQAAHAFRFFYHVTLGREKTAFHVPAPRQPQTLPAILSRAEVCRLLAAPAPPRLRLLRATVYAAGLRLSEAIHLKVVDIDPERMTIRVEQGKGAKDRYLPLSARQAFDRGALHFTGGLAALADPAVFAAWLHELRQPAWVVYCTPPFAGPDHVLAYLGRYTHRVAISNQRLVAVADGHVRFRWRDYADGDRAKVMDLEVDEFLRRFLLHIVPDGFVRIRHFGLLANRRRRAALARCRALLAPPPMPDLLPESVRDLILRVTGIDIDRCPVCQQGSLRLVAILPPAPPEDTS